MISLKILQYNTDNLRHGWDYFKKNLDKADLAVLQRFPRGKKSDLMDAMSGCRSYMVESCPPNDLCLAIARNKNVSSFSGIESITLPSAQHVIATGNAFQGCTALKTIVSGVNIISFLPCYAEAEGEFPISFIESKTDIKFLLEKFKNEPTIIFGDFHVNPNDESVNNIIKSNKFKSYLDNHKTFRGHDGESFFNLDKCISNVDIELKNICIDDISDSVGHMAITYTLNIEK